MYSLSVFFKFDGIRLLLLISDFVTIGRVAPGVPNRASSTFMGLIWAGNSCEMSGYAVIFDLGTLWDSKRTYKEFR